MADFKGYVVRVRLCEILEEAELGVGWGGGGGRVSDERERGTEQVFRARPTVLYLDWW